MTAGSDDMERIAGVFREARSGGLIAASGQIGDPRRYGAAPPETLVQLRENAGREVAAAAGVPSALLPGAGNVPAAAMRESVRQLLHGTIRPLARVIEAECERKGLPLALNFRALFASDLAGRARAFKQLQEGGMTAEEAARHCGFGE